MASSDLKEEVQDIHNELKVIQHEISQVIIGQPYLIKSLLIGLLADGHILLEGVPGVAKTLAVTTFAKVIGCHFSRIQFTPDLLPSDLLGTSVYLPKDGSFNIHKGPIFTQILLADEINRAPPKVQSALLEAMQERQVTISGETFPLATPYIVLATQNPVEQEGTYPLPEAQTDRFLLKVVVNYPSQEEEKEILKRMNGSKSPSLKVQSNEAEILRWKKITPQIYVDEKILDYIIAIISATRNPGLVSEELADTIALGASPRAALALQSAARANALLSGRSFVKPGDIKQIAPDILRHRLKLSYEGLAKDYTPDLIISKLLQSIEVP